MARKCQVTGKRANVANNVSHSHRKTKKRQLPNLQKKRIYIPELKRWVTVKLTTRALKTVTKKGLLRVLADNGLTLKDVT
jgi:large subunit ribosomal protein L28